MTMPMTRTKTRFKMPVREDESRPADPDAGSGHPLVVFGDHGFCAGERLDVMCMRAPHMHSQIEINFVLDGAMTYRFDATTATARAGELILFWGMVPHQVCATDGPTRFVCLYVPFVQFLSLTGIEALRRHLLSGGLLAASHVAEWERAQFMRWRDELLSGDARLRALIRDEVSARLARLAHEGWRDIAKPGGPPNKFAPVDSKRARKAEAMIRFISENAHNIIGVEDVARAAGLHPNYAMTLFRQSAGLSIHDAIMRHRIDIAQSLLIATERPVATIAFEIGFNSLSAFYAAFEKRFRTSPRAFRQMMRAKPGG